MEKNTECEYLSKCPIFGKFRAEGNRNVWISFYCTGPKQEECERKKLKKTGAQVPTNLLPNGKVLEEA